MSRERGKPAARSLCPCSGASTERHPPGSTQGPADLRGTCGPLGHPGVWVQEPGHIQTTELATGCAPDGPAAKGRREFNAGRGVLCQCGGAGPSPQQDAPTLPATAPGGARKAAWGRAPALRNRVKSRTAACAHGVRQRPLANRDWDRPHLRVPPRTSPCSGDPSSLGRMDVHAGCPGPRGARHKQLTPRGTAAGSSKTSRKHRKLQGRMP